GQGLPPRSSGSQGGCPEVGGQDSGHTGLRQGLPPDGPAAAERRSKDRSVRRRRPSRPANPASAAEYQRHGTETHSRAAPRSNGVSAQTVRSRQSRGAGPEGKVRRSSRQPGGGTVSVLPQEGMGERPALA